MKFKLDARFILILGVLSGLPFLKVSGQSQQYPPKLISDDYLFQNWTTRDGLPVNSISSIKQGSDGYLWLGTANGLVRFDGETFSTYSTSEYPGLENNRIRKIASLNDQLLILHNGLGLILFDGIDFKKIEVPEFVSSFRPYDLIQNQDGRILLPARERKVFSYTESGFQEIVDQSPDSHLEGNQENSKLRIEESELFYEGERILDLGDRINEVIIDREGTIWIASYSKGIFKIRRNIFSVYSEEKGLKSRNVYPVMTTRDGTTWVGTYGGGLATIYNGKLDTGYLIDGKSEGIFIKSIIERANGDILTALMDGSLYKYVGEKRFQEITSPSNTTTYALFEDSEEMLWLGSREGLFYKQEGEWEKLDHPRLANSIATEMAESPDGSLWIGTQGQGLFHLVAGRIETLTKDMGLSSNRIRSIWIDSTSNPQKYTVWVGTEDNGLTLLPVNEGRASPLQAKSLKESSGLFDNTIHQIIPDTLGRVWMNSNQGIFWVFKNDVYLFKKGTFNELTSTGFTEVDGLRSREGNGGVHPAGSYSSTGEIWFPTQDGVVQFNPNLIYRNNVIPPVQIDRVESGDGYIYIQESEIIMQRGDRDITFSFAGLSLVSPEKNRYRYRLFGFDEVWQETETNRKIRYTNLDPGTYRFRVIASNNDGVWNQQGAVVSITIPAYFHESGWFYTLILSLLALLALIGFYFIKSGIGKRLMKKEQELVAVQNKVEKLETKLTKYELNKNSLFVHIKDELKKPVVELHDQIEKNATSADKKIKSKAKYLLEYVEQLILLSELELRGGGIDLEKKDLVALARQVVEDCIANKECNKGIDFTTNTGGVIISTDINYCTIILRNLIKALVNDEEASKVKVQVVEESSICTIKISNDGKAYSHEELHAIFSLFKNYESHLEHHELIGISLPLVAKLVELHSATVLVHSIPGQGNTFSVVFRKGAVHFNNTSEEKLITESV